MANSTHRVDVVRIGEIAHHPNADALGIVKVRGYTCCVRLDDFKVGDLAAYIQPDSVVDTSRPEFRFLGDKKRVKVLRLRGVQSQGLLVKAPIGSVEGDDVAELLGVTHYDPPEPINCRGEVERGPEGFHPSYDVESYRNYTDVLKEGEIVWVTEKIHGACGRFVFDGERMYAGSKNTWKVESESNLWWKALRQHPEIEDFCRKHPDITVYGEVYGRVQNLQYGLKEGRYGIAIFDMLLGNRWLSLDEVTGIGAGIFHLWAPTIYIGAWHKDVVSVAEGVTFLMPGHPLPHIREGIVVKAVPERTDLRVGRVALKVVSDQYLAL